MSKRKARQTCVNVDWVRFTTIEIFHRGGFQRPCSMELRCPQNSQKCRKFYRPYRQTSCCVPQKGRFQGTNQGNKNIAVHQGVIGLYKTTLTECKSVEGLRDPFGDSTGVTFIQTQLSTDSWHMIFHSPKAVVSRLVIDNR